MRIAYFDCFSGISGDMTLGALLACGADEDALRAGLSRLNLPGWKLNVAETSKNGIGAKDVTVSITQEQGHGRHLRHIEEILSTSDISQPIQESALNVFRRLADAEAKIHQTTAERIHFHEVGAVDAIVDIVGTCLALESLGIDEIVCSPLPMGRGFVECAHGTIPLPAPAVLELTAGFPVYGVDLEGELVTPTGAAIVTTFATRFGPIPPMAVVSSGYGAGKKDFGNRPNLLRVVIGETIDEVLTAAPEVTVIEANLDDFSPQFYEPLQERLFAEGALDVFLSPIQMKKNRPATLLTVIATPDRVESMAQAIFEESTTLGIRYGTRKRICLEREWETVETEYGPIRIKIGRWRGRETTAAPEYEDVRAAAKQHGAPVKRVFQAAITAYQR